MGDSFGNCHQLTSSAYMVNFSNDIKLNVSLPNLWPYSDLSIPIKTQNDVFMLH
jgi:uncharacterized protein YycO